MDWENPQHSQDFKDRYDARTSAERVIGRTRWSFPFGRHWGRGHAAFHGHLDYTSNKYAGGQGLRVTLGTRSAGIYSDIPCPDATANVTWTDSFGKSEGLARDWSYSSNGDLWASITEEKWSDDCTGRTNGCIGVSHVDIGSSGVIHVSQMDWLDHRGGATFKPMDLVVVGTGE